MNRRNYRKELDRIIEKQGTARPRLLLQACCGPCSSSVLEQLVQSFDVTVLWYNPNLYPEQEFIRRYDTLLELIEKAGYKDRVQVMFEPWRSEEYDAAVLGYENEPEGGARCERCFRLRLRETAIVAEREGFDYFCTTLTVSRHKNAELINALGEELAAEYGVAWLPSDFKKRGGEDRSQELSKQYGLYQQLYCGCRFSLGKRRQDDEKS